MEQKTIETLKAFALVNQGIIIREGNVLRTMAVTKNIFGTATVPDSFPKEFAIYNLNEFLSVLSIFKEPEIAYKEEYIEIKGGKTRIKYFYSSPSVVVSPPVGKEIAAKDIQLEFDLKIADLQSLLKASGVLKSTDLVISDKAMSAITKNGGENSYDVPLEGVEGETTEKFSLKIDTLRGVIPNDYHVRVSSRVIFLDAPDLSYIIALDKA